ncbi:MAG: hypothetical protein NZM37_03125 [Sandaracinaceae bacterium]|nr:hypothetical protein [Sandaracinaceae bacterium]MDW8245125.1 hypothetical protein [Sandaracinaceae bacterium]
MVRFLSLCFFLFFSCNSSPPPPPPPNRPPPADALEAALRKREPKEAYALTPYEPPFRMRLKEGESQTFARVLKEGFCYKALIQCDDGVQAISARLFDPTNVLLQVDTKEGCCAALGGGRPLCPEEPGVYRIEIRLLKGEGEVLAQWYANTSL